MKPNIYEESGKIWKRVSEGATETELEFELQVYRKLLNFFQVGDYYYYIFNVSRGDFDFVSRDITTVLGYAAEEVSVPFIIKNIHPDDQPYFLNFEYKVTEFFSTLSLEQIPNYKVRYDYRLRKKNGNYIRVLQQVVTIQHDADKRILRTFGVHTDISQLKPGGVPVLSFIGLNNQPSYINVDVKERFSTRSAITPREQEILHLLTQGKSSEAISKQLFISRQTVNTHRKNLLKKTGCTSTGALTAEAVKRGWI